jgi:hypothetical protein
MQKIVIYRRLLVNSLPEYCLTLQCQAFRPALVRAVLQCSRSDARFALGKRTGGGLGKKIWQHLLPGALSAGRRAGGEAGVFLEKNILGCPGQPPAAAGKLAY